MSLLDKFKKKSGSSDQANTKAEDHAKKMYGDHAGCGCGPSFAVCSCGSGGCACGGHGHDHKHSH